MQLCCVAVLFHAAVQHANESENDSHVSKRSFTATATDSHLARKILARFGKRRRDLAARTIVAPPGRQTQESCAKAARRARKLRRPRVNAVNLAPGPISTILVVF